MRLQATQEGLVPLKTWVKSALDRVIQDSMGERDLEFVWVGDDAIDPLQQAQTLNILVSAGIKTREEARAELGLGGEGRAGRGAREVQSQPRRTRTICVSGQRDRCGDELQATGNGRKKTKFRRDWKLGAVCTCWRPHRPTLRRCNRSYPLHLPHSLGHIHN